MKDTSKDKEGETMTVNINNQESMLTKHERQAANIRKTYGENIIVWFQKGAYYIVTGRDAEKTEKLCGVSLEYGNDNGEFNAYLPKYNWEWRTALIVKQGYRLVILDF